MRRSLLAGVTLCLVLGLAVGLSADMKSRQKTQLKFEGMLGRIVGMFGGKTMKEGIVSTIAISGDRMMTVNDQSGELIDLAEEKVYAIDFKGKSYKVKTFAEIRKEWEEAQAKMKEQAAEAKQKEEQPQAGEPQYEVDFSIDKSDRAQDDQRLRLPAVRHDHHHAAERQEARGRRRHGDDHRHVDGAEAPGHAGADRVPAALSQEALRDRCRDDGARPRPGDGDVSPDEDRHGTDEEGSRQARRHGHPDHDEGGNRDVARAGRVAGRQRREAEDGHPRPRRPRRDVRQEEEGRGRAEGGPACRRARPEEPRDAV